MNKARIASSNKTGLVLNISIALAVLLAVLIYGLNVYFKNEKSAGIQDQIRKVVVSTKTSVSGQIKQLKNVLSSYESDFNETSVNWVQLDPFFAIANVDNVGTQLKVSKIVVRSNTPAERWNANYLELALKVNKSKEQDPILVQLFKDHAGTKFMLLRFSTAPNKELVLATTADYFQKYFDIQRGSGSKALLITTENMLAAHTEADYLATSSKEANLPTSKYFFEKEEIVGTNLIAVSYVLKNKIVSSFVVPWSIVGVVLGFGFVLIGILFYTLDPIERRVEKYKKQEREQIYKDMVKESSEELAKTGTLNAGTAGLGETNLSTIKKSVDLTNPNFKLSNADEDDFTQTKTAPLFREEPKTFNLSDDDNLSDSFKPTAVVAPEKKSEPEIINLLERATPLREATVYRRKEDAVPPEEIKPVIETKNEFKLENEFVTLDEEKIDLDEIEKALALDDFDTEKPGLNVSAEALEKNLKPQKINVPGVETKPLEKPQFVFDKKEFKVDAVKINIRRPERS